MFSCEQQGAGRRLRTQTSDSRVSLYRSTFKYSGVIQCGSFEVRAGGNLGGVQWLVLAL